MRLPNESVKGQEKQHHGVVVSEKNPTRVGAKERGIQGVWTAQACTHTDDLRTAWAVVVLVAALLFHPLKYFSRRFVGSSPIIQPDSIRS